MIKWGSKKHIELFKKEFEGVVLISRIWRSRIWQPVTIRRLKNLAIDEAEGRLKEDPYDEEARQRLSYYARKKWRPLFLFDVQCVLKIQRKWRSSRAMWDASEALREKYAKRAATAYNNYVKYSFTRTVRLEVLAVCKHRLSRYIKTISVMLAGRRQKKILTSANIAPVIKCLQAEKQIRTQDRAVSTLHRSVRSFNSRQLIDRLVDERRAERMRKINNAASIITRLFQMIVTERKKARMLALMEGYNRSAAVIQRFVRRRNTTFQHAVTRLIEKERRLKIAKQHSVRTLRRKFLPQGKLFINYNSYTHYTHYTYRTSAL